MTRFRGDIERITRDSDPGWGHVAGGFTEISGDIAERGDLIVRIAADAADGRAPACFIPSWGQIELRPNLFPDDLDPADIDPRRFSCRERMPVAQGAFTHECAHGDHTRWEVPEAQRGTRAAEAAILLEEPRIEAAIVDRRPGNRRWLRASAHKIVMADIPSCEDVPTAARVAALVLGRVDAGVLDEDETAPIRDAVLAALGQETYDELESIWLEALDTADTDAEAMMDLGRRWCEAIKADPEEQDPTASDGAGEAGLSGDGESGDGDPEPGSLAAAVAAVLGDISEATIEEISAPSPADKAAAARSAARVAEVRARKAIEKDAITVFGVHSAKDVDEVIERTERGPTGAERAAANRLAKKLSKARHRDRSRTVVHSAVPPGRVRGRAALQAQAQEDHGQEVTAEPFRQVKRKHVEQPMLKVGIAIDISGSQGAAEKPLSSVGWVFGNAVTREGGQFATVAYGSHAEAIVRPGSRPQTVVEFKANHSTEAFCDAVNGLDGKLGLTWGTGARLLVIVSDGHYRPSQRTMGQQLVNRLRRTGCAVLWIHFASAPAGVNLMDGVVDYRINDLPDREPDPKKRLTAAQVVDRAILEAATAIGEAAVKAVAAA